MVDSQLKMHLLQIAPGTEFPLYRDEDGRRLH